MILSGEKSEAERDVRDMEKGSKAKEREWEARGRERRGGAKARLGNRTSSLLYLSLAFFLC